MNLLMHSLILSPGLIDLDAGDVDGDGVDELILIHRTGPTDRPGSISLEIVDFNDQAEEIDRFQMTLGDVPIIWDVFQGIWVMNADGLMVLAPGAGPPLMVSSIPTQLGYFGPAEPTKGMLVYELDGQEGVELIVWSEGRYHAFRPNGTSLGSIPAPSEGRLRLQEDLVGSRVSYTLAPPSLATADMDGDGRQDLLLPRGDQVEVWFTGEEIGERKTIMSLPIDLNEQSPPGAKVRRRLAKAWFRDIDGDGQTDFIAHHVVLDGGFFGARAELTVALGTGTSFREPQVVKTEHACFEVFLVDSDGDGDLDVLAPQVDTGFGNMTRALVSRAVQVQLIQFRWDSGGFQEPMQPERMLTMPLQGTPTLHADMSNDLTGDGIPDLVTNDGKEGVWVYDGVDLDLDAKAGKELTLPPGSDVFFFHDLTGDGRAELVLWAREQKKINVLKLTP